MKGGSVGGDHHGGDVAGAQLRAADVDAHAVEHRLQRLLGERRVAQAVAGALEADDEAVADELVVAHALQRGDVLDARAAGERRGADAGERQRSSGTTQAAASLHLADPDACRPPARCRDDDGRCRRCARGSMSPTPPACSGDADGGDRQAAAARRRRARGAAAGRAVGSLDRVERDRLARQQRAARDLADELRASLDDAAD